MMVNPNKEWAYMSNSAIISAIGTYIKHQRLEQNLSQAQLAENAGLNRWTIGQIESGESVTLSSLIQILRVLDLLQLLDIFSIEERISPIEYARMQEKKRKRSS